MKQRHYSAARSPWKSLMSNNRNGCEGPVQDKKRNIFKVVGF